MNELDVKTVGVRGINLHLNGLPKNTNEKHWVIKNPMGQHSIAVGLSAPLQVDINGHVGFYCGGMNAHAELTIHGHAGVGTAENMMSGVVWVKGNSSESAGATGNGGLLVIDGDASSRCGISMKGIDIVFHIAANPDIRYGTRKTSVDLEQGTIATYNVLEAMRLCDVDKISYSSSSVVYGEADIVPTPEDYGPLVPLSLYGASKLACEGLISSFSNSFGMRSWLFRFANIIGRRGTHGVLVDFTEKLKKNPRELEILGDGTQTKSYLMVDECVDGMLFGTEESGGRVNIFNLGSTDRINVTRIAEILVEEAGLRGVKFNYTGGDRGWAGDIPKFLLSTEKIQRLGWKPRLGSEDAVRTAAKLVIAERWKAAKKKGNVRKG